MISMCVSLIQTREEFVHVHAFVTIKEVRPQTAKLALFLIKVYEIWNCTIFVNEYLEENPISEYIPNIRC